MATAIVEMDTELTPEEFVEWLDDLLKKVSINPDSVKVKRVCKILGKYRLVKPYCPIHKFHFENDLKQEEEKPCSHTWWHTCSHIFKHCPDCGALLPKRKELK